MSRSAEYLFQVQPIDVGFRERIRFVRLGAYLLDTAGLNASENGFGINVLHAEQRAWVLSRFAVEMSQYPKSGETFSIETWIEDFGRIFTTRNFCVRDASGEVIGGGSSIWCMIDMESRKAVDLRSKQEYEGFATGIPSPIDKPIKVLSPQSEPISRHRIKYSDIDFNRHTNSMKYLEWMLDLFPMEVYQHQQVKRMDVNYVNEAVFGDVVDIYRSTPELNRYVFGLKRGDDSICNAQLMFENVI
jgi:medium-chain acyl-[acyl-carrier-protein] hydrolase